MQESDIAQQIIIIVAFNIRIGRANRVNLIYRRQMFLRILQ